MVSEPAWWSIGLVIGGAVVSMLHTLGRAIENERQVSEVKAKVRRLRAQYARRMAEIEEQEIIVVDEAPAQDSLAERQAA